MTPPAPPTAADPLVAALGPPDQDVARALAALSPAAHAELGHLVGDARERQRRETRAAIDEALTHIPALLRGAVRKLLFP